MRDRHPVEDDLHLREPSATRRRATPPPRRRGTRRRSATRADPADGRVKIIRLTDRGREAQQVGRNLIDEIEREWSERYGEERVAALRDALETITVAEFSPRP
jgi:hypothetical protein